MQHTYYAQTNAVFVLNASTFSANPEKDLTNARPILLVLVSFTYEWNLEYERINGNHRTRNGIVPAADNDSDAFLYETRTARIYRTNV